LEVGSGKSLNIYLGIQNLDEDLDSRAKFKVIITPLEDKGKEEWFVIAQPSNIKVGEKSIVPLQVTLPKGLPPGTSYTYTIQVFKNDKEYSSQGIILRVKE